jgi:NADPH-dependent 2,4-dienoyl-CoA reductase/sulfur reductase-like enzyme
VSSEPGSHGTAARKQGRSAGENALGGDREIAGSLGTQIVNIFDQAAARTGLRDHEAALLLNSFEELASIATVRNWLVLDAKRFDARARYLSARERCHIPQPRETRSRVHYMAQPGDVTGLAGMTGALMYCAGRTGRYVSGQAPLGSRRPVNCGLMTTPGAQVLIARIR